MHSGPLKPGQRGLPVLIMPELGRCLSGEAPALQREPPWPLVPLLLSTPAFAGWHRELVSVTAIPACSSGEELRWLLGVTVPWFKRVWRQDETMLKLPLGACASLMLGQGLV